MTITTMESKFVCLVVIICVFFAHNVLAESSKNVSSTNPTIQPSKQPFKDELFIEGDSELDSDNTDKSDDNDLMLAEEGSGMDTSSKGTGAEDMESSGSGYGPDDEDAQVNSKTKGKLDIDSEEDEDDPEDENEEAEDSEDFDKEKPHKGNPAITTTTTTTTSTTTTTTENYEEPAIPELPKQKTIEDDVNVAPSNVPDVPQITTSTFSPPPSNTIDEHSSNGVYISPNSHPERTSSFFAQPGILAAVIGGAVVGLLCAILVVMFIVYRMRKKDEGSYPLEETKRSPATNPYLKSTHREFYA